MMQRRGEQRRDTAFATSIEARSGVSTGISAPDRARTISVAINALNGDELVTPGHVFPLMAQDGGVLVNAGYAEGAVDLVRLSGLNPSAVICEILNDDGSLAAPERVAALAADYGCKIGSIADLIAYRRRHDSLIEKLAQRSLHSRFGGEWTVKTYINKVQGDEHLVLYQGDIASGDPVLVRMHTASLFADMFGEQSDRAGKLERAMQMIGAEGRGAIVVLRERSKNPLSQLVIREGGAGHFEIRDYGIAAQILVDLGVSHINLVVDEPCNLVAADGYGLSVVDERPLPAVELVGSQVDQLS
jgi:3,4-dihydroxy 2-butanone 4-phosphate synthase/GTP cyclohydrolase II